MGASNGAVDLSLLDEVFEQYQGQHGSLIPILQKAQDKYGYLPPEALNRIAKKLGISVSQVYGVATFYAQFYLEKRGRHILRLCDGTACHVRGTPMLATAIEEQYGINPGETTEDGELTVEIVYCIGSCALAPVAIMDGEVMGRMKQDKLLRTVKKTLKAN
jgi:NADH:ubiquinone oxidoreductase subunit E